VAALRAGTALVTDTNMALSGVNRGACEQLGVGRFCYMADPQVAERARTERTTRAAAAVDCWASEHPAGIFAVGNAPTALLRLAECMEAGTLRPALVIGAPVGFVNVVESKERIWSVCQDLDVPAIVAMGRKGGSTVAAAVCNALLYQAAGLR
jgi:precorrin-8X/cobalt-precorrin-8 methylmutase